MNHLKQNHLTISATKLFSGDILHTPQKTNMEPENHPFEKEKHLPSLHFWVSMLNLRGVSLTQKTSWDFSMSKAHHISSKGRRPRCLPTWKACRRNLFPGKTPMGGWGFVLGVAGFLWVVVAVFFH